MKFFVCSLILCFTWQNWKALFGCCINNQFQGYAGVLKKSGKLASIISKDLCRLMYFNRTVSTLLI